MRGATVMSCTQQLSRGDCTTSTVVRYNCDVGDTLDAFHPPVSRSENVGSSEEDERGSPDDTELRLLLTQLLRLVGPAAADSAVRSGVPGNDAAVTNGAAANDVPAWPDAPGAGPALGAEASSDAGDGGDAGTAGIPQLSGSEARALIELVKARGIAQGELAGLLGLEKSTVSRLAAGLERKGWIRRGRDEGNQRYVRLYLTPHGAAVAARLWDAWQSRQARILAALTSEEREGLSAGLRGLVRGLAAEGLLGEEPPAQPRVPPARPAPGGGGHPAGR
jgi:DNA-binding MarR family transcriptional regulator